MTSIATHADNPNLLLSSSRDKTVLVWNITNTGGTAMEDEYGYVSPPRPILVVELAIVFAPIFSAFCET